MALMDLNTAAAADAGVEIEIYHPTSGEKLGLVITMLGSDSKAFQDADRKIAKRQKELAKRKKDLTAGLDPEQIEQAQTDRMVACFVGWREGNKNTLQLEPGNELAATKENFRTIVSDRGFFWLRQQVARGMDDISNFLPQQASNSSPQPSSDSATTGQEKTE